MMRIPVLLSIIMACCLIQASFAQWENAVLDTLTRNHVDDDKTGHAFVMGSDGTMHFTYYRSDNGGYTMYQYRTPTSDWSPVEYAMEGSDNVARGVLPKNVRPDSVWMVAQYGLSVLLLVRDASGSWTFQSETPFEVVVSSSDMAAAVDGSGRRHAVFVGEMFGTDYDLYYGIYNGTNFDWQALGAPVGPFGSGAAPEMVVEDNGVAHIFYRAAVWTYVINHTWNDSAGGSNWQTESLANANADNYTAKAIWSREYGLCAAISGNDGFGFPGRVFFHRKPPESGWLSADLATGTYSAVNGQLALDSFGNPMIVWEQTSGNILTGCICYAINTGQGWENLPLFQNGISLYPQVLMDSQDRGNLVFSMDYYPDDQELYFFGPEEQPFVPARKPQVIPNSVVLHPVYPNPLNAGGSVTFSLPTGSFINLGIYNILGQRIRTLASGYYLLGNHTMLFGTGGLSSGYYLMTLTTSGSTQTQRLIILK